MNFLQYSLDNELEAPAHSLVLDSGTRIEFLDTGVLRISPATHIKARHRVLISCGVHGNETAPMELVENLFQQIMSGELAVVNELLFVIGNLPAANKAERFLEENLNRLFSGKHEHSNSLEAKRAEVLEGHTRDFFNQGDEPRLHYDLHTAIRGSQFEKFAVYPFLHERPWSTSQIGFLERCGIQAVLLSNQPSGTYSYFTSHSLAADSFTVELGKVERFGDNDLSNFAQVLSGLCALITGQERFDKTPSEVQVFEVVEEVIKRSDDFKLHFPSDAKNFTEFRAGSLLASDGAYEYRTQRPSERFVFPITNVPIGQRAMLVVAPTTL